MIARKNEDPLPARRVRGKDVRNVESDHAYWKSRAQRSRQLADRQKSEHVREHYLKIVAGYEELARRWRLYSS